MEQVVNRLRSMVRGDVRPSEPMRHHTSLRVGGPADVYVRPADIPSLEVALEILEEARLPVLVVGLGTNLLVRDGGIRGAVVSTARLINWDCQGTRLWAEAGVPLPLLARVAARRGLSGLEFAAGIPGTVGGAVVMNAGAHGSSLSEVLRRVKVRAAESERHLEAGELDLGYRDSWLRKARFPVVEVELALTLASPSEVEARTRYLLGIRRAHQPRGVPSAGSFFRNPLQGPAGWFIEQAGCKGLRVGGAEVSWAHANFIVNRGGATARDILTLAEEVRQRVAARFSIWLEPEVQIEGEEET